jgi:hypothetical protein
MPNPDSGQSLQVETSLPDYFRRRLQRYAERLRPPPHEDTLWYLGEMMHRFSRSDHLFDYRDGALTIRPLALLYGDARSAEDHRERCLLLQRLGDMALFIGAFFPERHARRGIRRDYFIGMGSAAYDYLSEQARQNRHIYQELTRGFAQMLELVARAGHRRDRQSEEKMLQLYARWLETGDPVLAQQLKALGVNMSAQKRH